MKNCIIYSTKYVLIFSIIVNSTSCNHKRKSIQENQKKTIVKNDSIITFGEDLQFLQAHTDVVKLQNSFSQLILSPEYQGRVMTTTMDGLDGLSLGYINHDFVKSNQRLPHIQPYGGEDRFWLGPQGGQYTIFFNPNDDFTFDNWFTPSPLDTEPHQLVDSSPTSATLRKEMLIKNYQNNSFELELGRTINLLDSNKIKEYLSIQDLDELRFVGFESINKVTNIGQEKWTKDKGLISIWILGMFPGGSQIIIPTKNITDEDLLINQYFVDIVGALDKERLRLIDSAIIFNGDGNYISKIGVKPKNATSFLGSYDEKNSLLTIIQYNSLQEGEEYVNSQWEIQKRPYEGDVINAYNDGNLDRTKLAKETFYELETSSPGLKLEPNSSFTHTHRTYHFRGAKARLNVLTQKLLGINLEKIEDN